MDREEIRLALKGGLPDDYYFGGAQGPGAPEPLFDPEFQAARCGHCGRTHGAWTRAEGWGADWWAWACAACGGVSREKDMDICRLEKVEAETRIDAAGRTEIL